MGFNLIKLGSLYLDGQVQAIPQDPTVDGDIPKYKNQSVISIGNTALNHAITWVKHDNLPIMVADRTLLCNVSWDDIDRFGLTTGKKIIIDGMPFTCRLLKLGDSKAVWNEWSSLLAHIRAENMNPQTHVICEDLLHGGNMRFWGQEAPTCSIRNSHVYGGVSKRLRWGFAPSVERSSLIGFRPVLERLNPNEIPVGQKVRLDGQDFLVSQYPGTGTERMVFRPALFPLKQNSIEFDFGVFGLMPEETWMHMYTLLMDGAPVKQDATEVVKYKTGATFTITDEYFGDEYLIPWKFKDGVAIAKRAILYGIKAAELTKRGFR